MVNYNPQIWSQRWSWQTHDHKNIYGGRLIMCPSLLSMLGQPSVVDDGLDNKAQIDFEMPIICKEWNAGSCINQDEPAVGQMPPSLVEKLFHASLATLSLTQKHDSLSLPETHPAQESSFILLWINTPYIQFIWLLETPAWFQLLPPRCLSHGQCIVLVQARSVACLPCARVLLAKGSRVLNTL